MSKGLIIINPMSKSDQRRVLLQQMDESLELLRKSLLDAVRITKQIAELLAAPDEPQASRPRRSRKRKP